MNEYELLSLEPERINHANGYFKHWEYMLGGKHIDGLNLVEILNKCAKKGWRVVLLLPQERELLLERDCSWME